MPINELTRSFALAGVALLATAGMSSAVQASPSYLKATNIPFALAYGTCVYADSPAADCTTVRQSLLAEADPILNRFHFSDGLETRRSLRVLFDNIDRQAVKLREEDKMLAPETLSFMSCTADAMRDQNDFQRGVFISGSDAFKACEDIYDAYLARDRSSATVQRNVNFMRHIKDMLPNSPVDGQRLRREGLLTERGPRG